MYSVLRASVAIGTAAVLAACGGGGGGAEVNGDVLTGKQDTYTVGGSVSGLGSASITLSLTEDARNTVRTVTVIGTGSGVVSFTFADGLATQTGYVVRVSSAPSNLGCSIANSQSRIASAAVNNVQVNCELNTYTVSGTVTGLLGSGLQLQNNNADTLNVSAVPTASSVSFGFPTAIGGNSPYAVTVSRQPVSPSQFCSVTSGGSGPGTGNSVSNVVITCITNSFVVGGAISGLSGTGLQLQLNGGNTISIDPGSTSFAFTSTPLLSGTTYSVTVVGPTTSPVQNCVIAPGTGSGPVGSSPISSVLINCSTNTYTVGGNVSGLGSSNSGLQLALSRNGSPFDTRNITGDGGFAFNQALNDGNAYVVSIATPHPHFACTLSNASGTISGASVGTVSVSCVTPIQVSVSGLGASNAGLVLYNSYGANSGNTSRTIETRSIPGDGTFQFPTSLPSGRVYTIGIDTEHPDYSCSIANGDSSIQSAAVTVAVTCTQRLYRVRGSVTGLGSTSTGLRLRRETVGIYPAEEIAIGTANLQPFEFVTRLPTNTVVTLTEIGEPDDRVCTFSNATNSVQRTLNRADITDIAINCAMPAPLTITSITPANNATNVALSAPITITFSHPIDPATVNSSTVTLTSQHGSHPISVSVSNAVVTVTPQGRLMPSVSHAITVTTTVRGSGKESLSGNQTRIFLTGTGWATEQNSFAVIGSAFGDSHVRFDSEGRAVTLWSEYDYYYDEYGGAVGTRVTYSRCQLVGPQCSWSATGQLTYTEPNLGGATFMLSPIAGKDLLLLTVPWMGSLTDRRYEAGQWGPATSHPGESTNILNPNSLATDELGNAWLAHQRLVPNELNYTYHFSISRYTPGSPGWSSGTWSTPVDPFPSETGIGQSAIAFTNTNEALLLFTQWNNAASSTSLKSSTSGSSWSPPIVISSAGDGSHISDPLLKIDTNGNAVAVWLQTLASNYSVYSRRYSTDGGWAQSIQPLEGISGNAQHLQLVMDVNGIATAVWSQNSGSVFEIFTSRLIAGNWTAPQAISIPSGNAIQPRVAVGTDGSLIVLWLQGAVGSQSVYANRFTAITNQWSSATRLDIGTGDATSQSVDIRDDGTALAVWIKNSRLFVSRFE